MSVLKADAVDLDINTRVGTQSHGPTHCGQDSLSPYGPHLTQEFILSALKDANYRLDGRTTQETRPVSDILGVVSTPSSW